jgi:hypothetical protein
VVKQRWQIYSKMAGMPRKKIKRKKLKTRWFLFSLQIFQKDLKQITQYKLTIVYENFGLMTSKPLPRRFTVSP